MKLWIAAFGMVLLVWGCTTKETKNYVTNNYGPPDWKPPVVAWATPPEAQVRGRVGIDVQATDSSRIDSVILFVDGFQRQALDTPPYRFEVVTDSLEDGVHLLEARAFDHYGNLGVSPILRVHVQNQPLPGPRLLWVPDDYQTIQAAINASADYDTIRVRDGTYYETLNTFGKGIWIESASGPIRTKVNGINSNSVFTISSGDVVATIRGFWLEGAERLIRYELGGQANLFNDIFVEDTASALLYTTYSGGAIWNNLFSGAQYAVEIGYHWGQFYNNMIVGAHQAAFYNAAVATNPLTYGYTLFWSNGYEYDLFDPGIGDTVADPKIDLLQGRLLNDSPALHAGNPQILNQDGSRSDIGPFGGPWAYHN